MSNNLVTRAIDWSRRKSPAVLFFNAGSCGGCDLEALDALTPRYDLERLGLVETASPRQADILICTGAVTLKTRDRLLQIYSQMAEPRFVIALGACACSGGIFSGCYCVNGGVDSVIPVDVYVPGCAVRPEAVIDAVEKMLQALEQTQAADRGEGQ